MAKFLTLEEVAKKTGRKPEEIMTYVESNTLTGNKHYHYPNNFGITGHDIAFFPSVLDVIKRPAKAKAKKTPEEVIPAEEEPIPAKP